MIVRLATTALLAHVNLAQLSHPFAITLGLIPYEVIANAIKYAFQDTIDG